jgi:hypothetical protein
MAERSSEFEQLNVSLSEEFTSIIDGIKASLSSSTRSLLRKVLGNGTKGFESVEREVRGILRQKCLKDADDYFYFVKGHYTECCGWEACEDKNHKPGTSRHNEEDMTALVALVARQEGIPTDCFCSSCFTELKNTEAPSESACDDDRSRDDTGSSNDTQNESTAADLGQSL